MTQLRAEHYLILQMIEQSQLAQEASGSDYHAGERSATGLGDDWALTIEQPDHTVSLDENWSRLAARRCNTRLKTLAKAGMIVGRKATSNAGGRVVSYDLTPAGKQALDSATLDRFPHRVSVEVLLRQPGVSLSDVEAIMPQVEAAVQNAVDALLNMVGRLAA